MKNSLDDSKPIFLQIKEQLEDSIINETIKAEERVPSTNEFAAYYKINPATAAKGINELVAEGILFKRRGVGMFVTEDAQQILIEKRKKSFYENYMLPLKSEAEKLRISAMELIEMVEREDTSNED
ncbi:GntR family transcriptional regulator [Oceanobacillus profundus]|uniref:GntR family transcriptional regulator n=1 Tax=Oceanobacillus profundus TaxID=372463 RepID=A0A417YA27_9BACI|nr:GntR family transcriptional regulator [Oceanobacillus profundus]MBR3118511.1 GntR family transcriptional regulator [Oceanobacillus sp.]PAE27470.1 GntR family transcriptional regulator [Paenibacillus sp. 7884-2]MCM3400452.1 GntR family transcriptional regulator [Oceanobacillus profundus]MDO6448749.1 GntR family transcriptional regulator [Oceanobacillus profundus]RHW29558.1 GntR family transcriptional regulator [Oceanobacillus profundus]